MADGGGTSFVARDEPTLLFADGAGLTAAARGGDALGAAVGGGTLSVVAGDAAPSFNGAGGASESGADRDV
ncbi:hypothetical protein [Bradyrhizobium sp. CCBAU 51753]|uniref:hypothetical protein n=1 Tax=Bradyrhizobium sp. CCBAU 51753 TaxID=1325100 RepID=UPI00188CB33B|nr:hypothetical protein [Bradyrhizobium sp. CCBAU 51753]QOZ25063.1 hypothetical protein XH93_16785 [Bradyrhizobium sp. CCBAU 51753]